MVRLFSLPPRTNRKAPLSSTKSIVRIQGQPVVVSALQESVPAPPVAWS
jgi:hypothetical protein